MNSSKFSVEEAQRLNSIKPSGIRKMFARAQGLEGVISLGIGMPDLMPPNGLLNEIKNELDNPRAHAYTLNAGIPKLREKIVEKYEREYNLNYSTNGVVVGSGGTQVLYTALYAYTNPGDEVLVPDPGFVYYPTVPAMAGCKVNSFDLTDEFQVPIDNIAERFSKNTKLVIINSPSNPCGSALNEESIKAIADLSIDNDAIIISDEVYEHIIFDGLTHHPMANYAPDNTITLNSFSKTYCVTGWRLGYVIGNVDLIKPLAKLHPFIVANAPSLPQTAIANFMGTDEDKQFTTKLRDTLQSRRDVVEAEFSKIPGMEIPKITGSFYAFPKIVNDNYQGENPGLDYAEDIFEKAKVVTVAGSEFGTSRKDHIRISFGSANESLLKEAADRIFNALN